MLKSLIMHIHLEVNNRRISYFNIGLKIQYSNATNEQKVYIIILSDNERARNHIDSSFFEKEQESVNWSVIVFTHSFCLSACHCGQGTSC